MNKDSQQNDQMNVMQHIVELRKRILNVAYAIIIVAILSYSFTAELFAFFAAPFTDTFSATELNAQLIGTGPAEAFMLRMKLAFFAGVIFSCPWIFYQLWLFVEPGLYDNEKKLILPFVISTTVLFIIGMLFSYYLVLPLAYNFFAGQYESLGIAPTIRITEHLAIVIKLLLAFAFVFELPIVSVLLARAGILRSQMMIDYWRYVVLVVFVCSAIITPPDIFSQFLMAFPVMLLYVLSYYLVKMIEEKQS